LNTGEYRGAIERTLRTLTGSPELTLRVIEGTAYSDWEYTQKRDAAAVAQRQQATQKRYTEASAFASWTTCTTRCRGSGRTSNTGRSRPGAAGSWTRRWACGEGDGDAVRGGDAFERAGGARSVPRDRARRLDDQLRPALVAFLLAERRRRQQPGNGDGGA
jgi:hypothetical protein